MKPTLRAPIKTESGYIYEVMGNDGLVRTLFHYNRPELSNGEQYEKVLKAIAKRQAKALRQAKGGNLV